MFFGAVFFDVFGVDFVDFNPAVVGNASVNDGFVNGFVSVVQSDVFANHADPHLVLWRGQFADHFPPVPHICRRSLQTKMPTDQVVHALLLEHYGNFVNGVLDVFFFDDGFEGDVAEERDFLANLSADRLFAAADEDVGGNADFAEFGYGIAGWAWSLVRRRLGCRGCR